jgi:large subunit ribosomal protein L18e
MSKRTGPTNPVLIKLITELKKKGSEENANLWRRIASELERPTRSRRAVNLLRINKYTKENEVIIVPGKVLGSGEIDHKITVAAYQFSTGAQDKINKLGKAITITELMKENPKGSNVRIIG